MAKGGNQQRRVERRAPHERTARLKVENARELISNRKVCGLRRISCRAIELKSRMRYPSEVVDLEPARAPAPASLAADGMLTANNGYLANLLA